MKGPVESHAQRAEKLYEVSLTTTIVALLLIAVIIFLILTGRLIRHGGPEHPMIIFLNK